MNRFRIVGSLPCCLHPCIALLIYVTSIGAVTAQGSAPKAKVPPANKQAEVRKLLGETFEIPKANTPAKKQQTAQKLMEMADDPATSSDELYVVLQTALPLLRDVNDLPTHLTAVDRLIEAFDLDAGAERTNQLAEYMTACKSPTTLEPASNQVLSMAETAAQENEFRTANELLNVAERHAKRVGATKLLKTLVDAHAAIRGREQAYTAMTQAQKTLATKPEDPKANLAVGQWLAIYESKWDEAIPKLLLGSDAKWKAAAAAEPKSAADIEAQLTAADAWWEVSQTATSEAKLAAQRRAHEWYEQYLPNVKSPLVKARVTKRLEELASAASSAPATTPADSTSESTQMSQAGELPSSKLIDLQAMVKLPEHMIRGEWIRKGSDLISQEGETMIMFPVAVRGSYELNFELTPSNDGTGVKIMFPVGNTSCGIVLNIDRGGVAGLEELDGRNVRQIDVSTGAVARPGGKLVGNKRYRVEIEVTQANDQATIETRFDNARLFSWSGKVAQLSQYPAHVVPCPQAVAVMNSGVVNFHKSEIRLKRGAKAFRLGDDWKNPITQTATTPPKIVAPKCVAWRGRQYLFTEDSMTFNAAQRLASQLQGRLLTISSADEEAFITQNSKGHTIWMSGWRRTSNKEWRDERNRPLRYFGKWFAGQPDLIFIDLNLQFATQQQPGWHDVHPEERRYVCIEWGEEYSEAK